MSANASTSPAINLMNEVQTAFEHHLVTLQAQARDPFLAHAQELQACFDLFSDDASKRYYATELVFLMMRTVKPEFGLYSEFGGCGYNTISRLVTPNAITWAICLSAGAMLLLVTTKL